MAESKPEKKPGGGEQTLSVALRIRPINDEEALLGTAQIAYKVEDNVMVLMDPTDDPDDILRQNRSREKTFVFDYIFDPLVSQSDVYEATTKNLIPSVIQGYNATVFAYGATGAGKTYTMLGNDTEPGIMVRALNDLFLEMDKTRDDLVYKVTMSYLEIYNEMIRDLLNPSSGMLDLREDAVGGVQVAGLSEFTTRSTREVMDMLIKGNKERTQEPTAANRTSSRSHAVLQVTVMQRNKVRSVMQEVRTGKLFLIDLAGSERAANTLNRGKRMVEGAHINRSLLALGNCINALSDKNVPRYVNYRDSKLTRLLKDALGGNCKTVMIAHVSPASKHFEESRNTLLYADRAKQIKTKVRRNVTDVAYHIAQYTNIIAELREEVMRLREKLHTDNTTSNTRQSIAHIQAVRSEVQDSSDGASKALRDEVIRMKEKLLNSFKDQMELRKSLMELNNASMEVSLETNRNQLIISHFEVEKTKMIRKSEQDGETLDGKLKDLDKVTDLSGADELQDPEEVKIAREELKVLHAEKQKTEKIRITIQKELTEVKSKTSKLEEAIPGNVNSDDHREILQLLCRVHELEMENMEAQSSCLLRDFQIKKKDMILTQYRTHRNLCDEIIQQQKVLIDDNNVDTPKDLDELYDLYFLERKNKIFQADESEAPYTTKEMLSIPSYTRLAPIPTINDSRRNEEKIFTPSAKFKDMRQSDSKPNSMAKSRDNPPLNNMWRNNSFVNLGSGRNSPSTPASKAYSEDPRVRPLEGSLFNPSDDRLLPLARSRSKSLSPAPCAPGKDANRSRTVSPDRASLNSLEEKSVISVSTRGIAALAAKKKSKVQNDASNYEKQRSNRPLFRPVRENPEEPQEREDYLSPSRLEKHNRIFSDPTSSYVTDPGIHPSVLVADRSNRHAIHDEYIRSGARKAELARLRKNRHADNDRQRQPRRGTRQHRNTDEYEDPRHRRSRHNYEKDNKAYPVYSDGFGRPIATEYAMSSRAETFVKDDLRANNQLVPYDNVSIKNYHMADGDKRAKKKRRPKVNPPPTASDSSSVSTPQKTTKRPLPTIPAYRKGDINITGTTVPSYNLK